MTGRSKAAGGVLYPRPVPSESVWADSGRVARGVQNNETCYRKGSGMVACSGRRGLRKSALRVLGKSEDGAVCLLDAKRQPTE